MSTAPRELPPVTLSEQDGIRYLHLGSIWVQGAMRIRQPQYVELEYVRRMLAALLWFETATLGQGRALHLGLGAGSLARFTAQQLRMATTVVELNPQVIEIGARWFHVQEDERLALVQADAGSWLREHNEPGSVRLLSVDMYDEDAAAPVLDSAEFYADCRRALDDEGLLTINLFGRRSSFQASARKVADAFGADRVWSLQPTVEGNTALIGARATPVPEPEVMRARAMQINKRFLALGLKAASWPRMVRPWVDKHEVVL